MSYPKIVAAIDAELERLRRARLLLTTAATQTAAAPAARRFPKRGLAGTSTPSPRLSSINTEPMPDDVEKPTILTPTHLKSSRRLALHPQSLPPQSAAENLAAPMPAELKTPEPLSSEGIAPRVMPSRALRNARQPRAAMKTALQALGALAGQVPATPVYVSAAQINQSRDARAALESTPASRAAASLAEIPTAEMLSRRWLTGAAH